MIYLADISTPANTPVAVPQHTVLSVTVGLVYKLEVIFPPGSSGLMGVAICDGGYQVWPSSNLEWFRGDDEMVSFDDVYVKEQPPFQFDIYTYNLDDTYDHSVFVRVGLVSKEAYMARFVPEIGYEAFRKLIEDIIAAQEAQKQVIIEGGLKEIYGE